MHGVPLIPISQYGKLNPNTMIVYQGEVDNEDKVGSNIENKIDEKPGQDEEPAIEKASILDSNSIALNPVKPVTPVTFPESGTESEVCLYTHYT